MPGSSDYTAQNLINWSSGQLAMPVSASRWLALFTTIPADAGTGGTEVSGGSYARVQVAGPLTTNATTASGNATLHFASVPSWIVAGMTVTDTTTPASIPAGTTVLSTTGTTVVMSANAAGAGVGGTDVIQFSAWPAASASSGAEPATAPAQALNGAVITFPQATASWGTVVAWGLYDAVTSGNLLMFDYMGNFKWLPFSGSSASPSVLTSPAHGYSNADSVVVTQKYGGVLPATAGSWAGLLTVASVATDTFTAGVNSTGTGDGQVRKVLQQPIAINVTASFAASTLTLTQA
jgi:hypothetical protein